MPVRGLGLSYWSEFNKAGLQQRSTLATVASAGHPMGDGATVSISAEARAAAASQAPTTGAGLSSRSILSLSTDKGQQDIDIDDYFTPRTADSALPAWNFDDPDSAPPLLAPTPDNVSALAKDASGRLKSMLAAHRIPFGPSSIGYDMNGQIELPTDYPYSGEFKQALQENPVLERELSTVNALADGIANMSASVHFSQEYSEATTRAQTDALVAKYRSLFDGTQHQYKISLRFDEKGDITPFADDQPYAEMIDAGIRTTSG